MENIKICKKMFADEIIPWFHLSILDARLLLTLTEKVELELSKNTWNISGNFYYLLPWRTIEIHCLIF